MPQPTTNFQDARYNRPIRQLDHVLINKIAAGEVVDRPASVVKELVENALDSGASTVEITARKSGTTLITVTDDGCGIRKGDIRAAFERHATSKIENIDQLFSVSSYGFRGEALPSIASVSHLALTTRHFSEREGYRIVFEGGKEVEFRPASTQVGTKVEVSHLFFNTPARQKFLKAEVTESRHIIRVAERMAMCRPSVAMKLDLNGRSVFALPQNQPPADRMATLFGIDDARQIVEYDVSLGGVDFLVYLAHPDLARQDRTRICLFINGRSVASSSIIHAVTAGYGEFLPGGRFPLAAIYLSLPVDKLDVNVHPTKAEVRLEDERAIHDNLYRIVNKALRDWRMVPGAKQSVPPGASGFNNNRVLDPSSFHPEGTPGSAPRRNESLFTRPVRQRAHFSDHVAAFTPSQFATEKIPCDNSKPVTDQNNREAQRAEIDSSTINYLGKIGTTYLAFTIEGELYVVDQHAAHERILYENALERVEAGSAASQSLLMPETVELSGEEFLVFQESAEALQKIGFDVSPFGQKAIVINGMPPVFRDKSPTRVVRKLIDDVAVLRKAGGELAKAVAQSMACRAAVMAGDILNAREAATLIERLLASNNPYCCPHGRPTFIKISLDELDGRFGRR
jgi:DNA mismatch repair protein MutL